MSKSKIPYYYTEGKYILDKNGLPKEEHNLFKWGEWFETAGLSRIVKKTKVGKKEVSTVFLGMDYRYFREKGKPLLWETMVFCDDNDEDIDLVEFDDMQTRYTSRLAAVRGHNKIVKLLQK